MFRVSAPDNVAVLRALIEHPREVTLWGTPYQVTPRLCSQIFGDGRQLVTITPINFRPHYFVVRVDSAWHTDCRRDCNGANCIYENLDDIKDALNDDFAMDMYECYGLDVPDEESEEYDYFYADMFDCGCSWGPFDWPGTNNHMWQED
jgi:hypothetical protein